MMKPALSFAKHCSKIVLNFSRRFRMGLQPGLQSILTQIILGSRSVTEQGLLSHKPDLHAVIALSIWLISHSRHLLMMVLAPYSK